MADSVGVDIGSTNVKASLLDGDGWEVASAARRVARASSSTSAELDAAALWQAVLDVLAELAAAAVDAGHRQGLAEVGTVGLCGQYSSIVPVGADLEPVAPMRLYLDTRGTAHCHEIMGRHPDAFATWLERHPIPPVGGGLALGHLLAFQIDDPATHAATRAYLEPVDYVTTRLTGRVTATQGSMFAGQLIDNRCLHNTGYDPDLVAMAGVDPERLPPLITPDSVIGPVSAEVAEATGLPVAALVKAGMTDTQAAALATGVSSGGTHPTPPSRLGVAIGTTAVVVASTDRMAVDLDHEVLSMPGVNPSQWLVWAENGLAGRAVEHVLDRWVHASDPLGDHRADSADGSDGAFAGLEAALAASPPAARGVRFLPWLSGSLSPQADPTMRGGFVGLSLAAERVDLVRAAVEGVAHNLRWLLDPVEAFTGRNGEDLVLVGGAARSQQWCQILADITGRPVRTVTDPGHAGCRAVAAWAADSEGPAVADAPSPGNRWGRSFDPDPDVAAVHDEAQAQFVAAFEALRPLRLG